MAKGGYFIIGYPDNKTGFDIDGIVSSIQKLKGEVAYILHDKDDCKPHYHILCMWSKKVPDWEIFLDWMKEYHCICPDYDHRGKTPDENRYCKRVAVVRDVDACLSYMTHEHLKHGT